MSNTNICKFTMEYFSSLDYNPDITNAFLHTNDMWSFQLNLLSIITPRDFDLFTSAMPPPLPSPLPPPLLEPFNNYSQIIIDPNLGTTAIGTTWKQVSVISKQHEQFFSLQIKLDGTTFPLSWRVKFFSDQLPYNGVIVLQSSIELEVRWKNRSWNEPQGMVLL